MNTCPRCGCEMDEMQSACLGCMAEPPLAGPTGSDPQLFVEVRLYNQPGIYRVLTIGGDGRKDSDMDAARILRKLALWVETKEWTRAFDESGQ